ncbi:MAG: hypothetical protein PHI41_11455, partial [Erysipelotrichaceae bacterium]|nr:hypothetical protein [Erysipelotrichaceae bacterium]
MFKGGKGAHEVVAFQDIVDVVKNYVTNPEDLDLINRAYEFIMIKHADQKRRSGEPYTNHLLWVAY